MENREIEILRKYSRWEHLAQQDNKMSKKKIQEKLESCNSCGQDGCSACSGCSGP